MDLKRKVGLLPDAGQIHAAAAAHKDSSAQGPPRQLQRQLSAGQAAPEPVAAPPRHDKEGASLLLWKQWAEHSLGQTLVSEPTHEELYHSDRKIKALERKCADLAARAQRRLAVSAALRSEAAGGPGERTSRSAASPSPYATASHPQHQHQQQGLQHQDSSASSLTATGGFNRQAQWSARERRRSAAYEAVRSAGVAERDGTAPPSPFLDPSPALAPATPQLKSRGMLTDLLATAAATTTTGHRVANGSGSGVLTAGSSLSPGPGGSAAGFSPGGGGHLRRSASGNNHNHNRRVSAANLMVDGAVESPRGGQQPAGVIGSVTRVSLQGGGGGGVGGGAALGRMSANRRPWSAAATLQAAPSSKSLGGGGGPRAGSKVVDSGVVLALQQEMDDLRAQLDEAHHTVENKSEMEAQLREAIDVLRARVAAQGARELEHQRRLQQHARLEPIFDRLAECFTFRTPEEVVARLEFLEDEKLGSFDELLRAQEEVATLQQQLGTALSRVEVTRTQVTSQHLEAAGRLQARNSELQGELESLEFLNRKLEARQQQLVSLQGAVLDLWGRCQQDASFVAANTDPITNAGASTLGGAGASTLGGAGASTLGGAGRGSTGGDASLSKSRPGTADGTNGKTSTAIITTGGGGMGSPTKSRPGTASATPRTAVGEESVEGGGAGEGAMVGANAGDLESILSLIKELMIAKNPAQAVRHYQAMQQVAHRVWSQHFTHKRQLRGKVVETFEALSNLSEIMAAKIRSISDQLTRSKAAQSGLEGDLEKLQVQKRALQAALQRRDSLVRDMSGVPRSQRPDTQAAYQQILLQDSAAWGPGPSHRPTSRQSSRCTSPVGRSQSAHYPPPQSSRRPASARPSAPLPPNPLPRGTLAAAQAAAAVSNLNQSVSFGRPASAPSHRRTGSSSGGYNGELSVTAVGVPMMENSAAFAQPLYSSRGNHVGHIGQMGGHVHHVSDLPEGGHWSAFLQRPSGPGAPRPRSATTQGALFQSQSSVAPTLAPSQPTQPTLSTKLSDSPTDAMQQKNVAAPEQFATAADLKAVMGGAATAVTSKSVAGGVAVSSNPAVGGAATDPAEPRWTPPKRSDIEAGFLQRLQRAAAPGGQTTVRVGHVC